MKIQLKQYKNGDWVPVKVEEIAGTSIAKYMMENPAPIIAAILEEEKPVLFISNSEEWVEKCKKRGLSISAEILLELCGTEVIPKILLDFTQGSDIVEVKTLTEGDENAA